MAYEQTDTLHSYYTTVRRKLKSSGKLSMEDEHELADRIKEGDEKAIELLCEANLAYVISVAREYQSKGLSIDDLIGEGNIGLIEAAKRYTSEKNTKFISYAVWWIRQSILAALGSTTRSVKLPNNVNREMTTVTKAIEVLKKRKDFTGAINDEDIAEYTGLSVEKVAAAQMYIQRNVSFDDPLGEEGGTRLDTFVVKFDAPDETFEKEAQNNIIKQALKSLPYRERAIIKAYYGIDQEFAKTPEQIAEDFGLTDTRVSQIIRSASETLRNFGDKYSKRA